MGPLGYVIFNVVLSGGIYGFTQHIPISGKTTAIVKNARQYPIQYAAGRKEIMKEVEESTGKFSVS